MGVPIAIAASGVLILALNLFPDPLLPMVGVLAAVSVAWTWIGLRLYRAYGPALVDALRHRRLLDTDADLDATVEDAAVARRLVAGGDVRSARLGLELVASVDMPGLAPELHGLADDPRPEVRLAALTGLAASGDDAARARWRRWSAPRRRPGRGGAGARGPCGGPAGPRGPRGGRGPVDDPSPAVRGAALDSLQPGDAGAAEAAARALEDPLTAARAMDACGRLGDALLAHLAPRLEVPGGDVPAVTSRLVRALASPSPARDELLGRHVRHPDRELGRLVMDRLAGAGPAAASLAEGLDAVLQDDAGHAARILAASVALASSPGHGADGAAEPRQVAAEPRQVTAAAEACEPVRRALEDELALVRDRAIAGRVARHGRDRLGPAILGLVAGEPSAALAAEALEVVVGAAESRIVVALLDPRLTPAQRLERLAPVADGPAAGRDARDWLQTSSRTPTTPGDRPGSGVCAPRRAAAGMARRRRHGAARALRTRWWTRSSCSPARAERRGTRVVWAERPDACGPRPLSIPRPGPPASGKQGGDMDGAPVRAGDARGGGLRARERRAQASAEAERRLADAARAGVASIEAAVAARIEDALRWRGEPRVTRPRAPGRARRRGRAGRCHVGRPDDPLVRGRELIVAAVLGEARA